MTNPWVVGFSLILNVLSLAAGVYFYIASQKYRELAFYVHPNRASIVTPHVSTDIHVLFNGREIEGGVTAAQISIWNRGSESIKREAILDSIRIVVKPPCPILRANIQKVSRSVAGISLSMDRSNEGLVPVSWQILEKGDGAVVQIMYAGTADSQISVVGTIEGQREIFALRFPGQIRSASEQVAKASPNPWLSLVFGIALLTNFWIIGSGLMRKGYPRDRIQATVLAAMLLANTSFLLYLVYPYVLRSVPPFGY